MKKRIPLSLGIILSTFGCTSNPRENPIYESPQLTYQNPIELEKPIVYIKIEDLGEKDKMMIVEINNVLKLSGFSEIPIADKIEEKELDKARLIYGEYMKRVDEAEDEWLKEAELQLREPRKKLYEKIKKGDLEELPVESEANSSERRHPYEAISQVLFNGRRYVIRVHPDDAPPLRKLGERYDLENTLRINEFNSTLRRLFSTR